MIESNNPEINVDELMRKIREEVANRQGYSPPSGVTTNGDASRMMSNISYIQALIGNAESRACVRRKWPDKLNRFPFNISRKLQEFILKVINFLFKDQREVNLNIINSFKESVALNKQLIVQIAALRSQLDERYGVVDTYVEAINERYGVVDTRVEAINERYGVVDTHVEAIDERLDNLDKSIQSMNDSFNGIDILINNWISGIDGQLDGVNVHMQQLDERLNAIAPQIQRIDEQLKALDTRIQKVDERYISNDNYLKNDLIQQKRLITMFLEEARRRLPEPFNQEQVQIFVNEDQHMLDAFYLAFEDQFRGSREDIQNRLKVYLPLIKEAKAGTEDRPILDVGCGRGEWLELLRESGYTARGLDINRVMIEQCRTRGLEVIEEDVVSYLRSLPDESLGAITGFHIIEHLPFLILIKLFDEVLRVLQPGGIVIFETPNPENILVGSNTFYTDPTHRNPLPSSLIKFIAESKGLFKVVIMNLHPYPDSFKITDDSELAKRFNDYFYGVQDYGIIGHKP